MLSLSLSSLFLRELRQGEVLHSVCKLFSGCSPSLEKGKWEDYCRQNLSLDHQRYQRWFYYSLGALKNTIDVRQVHKACRYIGFFRDIV